MGIGLKDPIYDRDGCRTDATDLISDHRVSTDIAPVFAGLPEIAAPPVS
jgi:hypothetical protein